MPPERSQHGEEKIEYDEAEIKIQAAVETREKGGYENVQSTRCASNIKDSSDINLIRRTRGHQKGTRAHNSRLDPEQEQTLIYYMNWMEDVNLVVHPRQVGAIAQSILLNSDPEAAPLKKDWAGRFMERHGRCSKRKQISNQCLDVAQSQAHDALVTSEWFKNLQTKIEKLGIEPDRLWNSDEQGIRIEISRGQIVILRNSKPKKKQPQAFEKNPSCVTVIETVSAAGRVIRPQVIVTAKEPVSAWANCLPYGYRLSTGEGGHSIDDHIALDFIRHFNRETQPADPDQWRLLLCDGSGSNNIREVLDYCKDNKIELHYLPRSSHLLQLFDVGLFKSGDRWGSHSLDRAIKAGHTTYPKLAFMNDIVRIREQVLGPESIKNAFAKAGIWPMKTDNILNKCSGFNPEESFDESRIAESSIVTRAERVAGLNRQPKSERRCRYDKPSIPCKPQSLSASGSQEPDGNLSRIAEAPNKRQKQMSEHSSPMQKRGSMWAQDAGRITARKEGEKLGKRISQKMADGTEKPSESPLEASITSKIPLLSPAISIPPIYSGFPVNPGVTVQPPSFFARSTNTSPQLSHTTTPQFVPPPPSLPRVRTLALPAPQRSSQHSYHPLPYGPQNSSQYVYQKDILARSCHWEGNA